MTSDASIDEKVDRLACSYLLVRAMYWATIETAATHYARLIEGPDVADLVAAIQTAAAKEPDPDAVERDAPIIEAIESTGGRINDVGGHLQLFNATRARIVMKVSALIGLDTQACEASLTAYAVEQAEPDDVPASFTAWLEGVAEEEDEDEEQGDDGDDEEDDSDSAPCDEPQSEE